MRIVKVLLLDDAPWFLPNLTEQDVKFEIIQEGPFGTLSVYDAPVEVCEAVTRMTESGEVGLIVVGNNMGAGLPKARAVAEKMRGMTVVVWNDYYKGAERPYAALGLKHFCSRSDLEEIVPAMLGLGQ